MTRTSTLALILSAGIVSPALADGIFKDSYAQTGKIGTESSGLIQTSMTNTFDGVRYWACSGGGPDGIRLASFDDQGVFSASFEPQLDFRAVFSSGGNSEPIYGRAFADSTIYVMSSPGVFEPHVSLSGNIDFQSAVCFNSDATEYAALNPGGLLGRWDLKGNELKTITFKDWGSRFNEAQYPQDRGAAAAGGYYLTYSEGNLSAWDLNGDRVGTTVLEGAGMTFDSHFSLSFANDMVWVIDVAGGEIRGYFIPELLGDSCYADCDSSGTLDIDDFICFQTLFALGDPYGDCDGDTGLTIDDFICFQTLFAIGC